MPKPESQSFCEMPKWISHFVKWLIHFRHFTKWLISQFACNIFIYIAISMTSIALESVDDHFGIWHMIHTFCLYIYISMTSLAFESVDDHFGIWHIHIWWVFFSFCLYTSIALESVKSSCTLRYLNLCRLYLLLVAVLDMWTEVLVHSSLLTLVYSQQ